MFNKILVATDLSEVSDRVVGCLAGLRRLGAHEALLMYSINIRDVSLLGNEMMELAKPQLERQKALLEQLGFQVRGEIAFGLPQLEINRLAEEHNASLIIVGSHGRSMAGEILLGGVSTSVIHNARRPVLVIRLRIHEEGGMKTCEVASQDLLSHVIHPTDFSSIADEALSVVEEMASAGARKITLVHVQDYGSIMPYLADRLDEFDRIDRERLEAMRDRLLKAGALEVSIELLAGSPAREIINMSRSSDGSLIVLGTQGKGFVKEFFLGSVSHRVTRGANIPVLLVPPAR